MKYTGFRYLLLAGVAFSITPAALQAQEVPAPQPSVTTSGDEEEIAEKATPVFKFDTISVTASREEKLAIETPASISIVTEEEIERRQPETVNDMLKDIPGVELTGGSRNTVMTPSIRGLGDDRVVTRIDGARHNFNVGHKGGLFIDPAILKQVEVLRGPASTIHGTGALGGVVAFETKSADDFLEDGETFGGQVTSGFGTVDNAVHGNLTAFARPLENIDFLASLSRRKTDDYEAGDGEKRPYTDDDLISGLIKTGIDIGESHRVGLTYRVYTDDHSLPATADGTSVSSIVNRESRETGIVLDYDYENPENKWFDASVKGYYNNSDIDEVRFSDGRHDERNLETLGIEAYNTSRFELDENAKLAVTLGGEYFNDDQTGRRNGAPTTQFYPDADMDIYGVYIDNTLTLFEDLEVTAGLRFDSYDLQADTQKGVNETALSPRVMVSYQVLPFLQPYASYSEAFRAPSLSEIYNSGLHFPGGGPTPNNFFVPNPDLKPETAQNWEVGFNVKHDGLFTSNDAVRAKAAYFHNSVDDFIEQNVNVSAGTTTSFNVPKAEIKGFEAEISYDSSGVFGSIGAARIRGKNTDTAAALSGIPADKAAVTIGYHISSIDLDVGGRGLFVRDQERVPSGSSEIDGYATFDVFAGWDADDYVPGLKLNFAVDNLLDKTYRRGAAVLDEPGRNVKVTASLRF
ncbi:TonB-dependent hemoglobin/transferrin/lactoferrin family receptor [Kiloniella laminariae]|uniref:TonB-dependent hemoglobin/transferrin/lactoferrin family receptor n=1 Tax=Kiloniella laminariae TaxID=454162 RepID=A0ABT4LM55_9PROT|nr:TonB-dependent hemoglobin/transferrin/lactoferrin family receptor [Kiloniella laminariae]MCZ4282191.1 TonB-dependent hemoglobin/transferrin/lactoferrin family receptor [Kiloniella laminariae]